MVVNLYKNVSKVLKEVFCRK